MVCCMWCGVLCVQCCDLMWIVVLCGFGVFLVWYGVVWCGVLCVMWFGVLVLWCRAEPLCTVWCRETFNNISGIFLKINYHFI